MSKKKPYCLCHTNISARDLLATHAYCGKCDYWFIPNDKLPHPYHEHINERFRVNVGIAYVLQIQDDDGKWIDCTLDGEVPALYPTEEDAKTEGKYCIWQ